MKQFEFLEHTGDLRLRARGENREELFGNAARGMTSFIFGESVVSKSVPDDEGESIDISNENIELLLVDWLSELLFLMSTKKKAFVRFEFETCTDTHVSARVHGLSAPPQDDIKAVTYSELEVVRTSEGFEATVVFDI